MIQTTTGGVFNNAAQIWNHTFYWNCLSPNGGGAPNAEVAALLTKHFGSVEAFKEEFTAKASAHFGSGWVWLVQEGHKLKIVDTHDAHNPLRHGMKPLLVCDVWEHAYYVDYRNARPKYIDAFWALVNWSQINASL